MTQDGCNPCRRVRRVLDGLTPGVAGLRDREVAFDSKEGLELATRHSIAFPPAVLVDGRLVGKGKIRESELRNALGLSQD